MSFPRYPSYKSSGVEWLGDVPAHWSVKRLRFVAELNPSKSEANDFDRAMPVSFLPMEAIGDDGSLNLENEKTIGELESGYTYFRNGDVTVAKITPCYENGKGALMRDLKNGIGFGTTELIVARPKPSEVLGPYLHYLFISPDFRSIGASNMYGAGGQKRVPDAFVRNFTTAFPPVAEQTRIAEFLDRETAKIDELVAEQRRLMELLKEKRQAVISHAVTRGLNPKAPLKPSGIEWLGDVPKHWEVMRVKSVSTFITSGPRGWSERVGEAGPLFVQSGDLNDSLQVELATAKRVQIKEDAEAARTRLMDGDVVVCITGAKTGNVAVCASIPEPAYVNQHLCLVRPSPEILPIFLGVGLKSRVGQIYFEFSQYGLKQGLSLEDIKEAPIFLPPIAEQTEIVAFVGDGTARFATLTAEAQRAIDLLQERRTALISAAVTGQIDVRGAVAGSEHESPGDFAPRSAGT